MCLAQEPAAVGPGLLTTTVTPQEDRNKNTGAMERGLQSANTQRERFKPVRN